MRDAIKKGRKLSKKAAAYYATYEATSRTVRRFADKHCPVWQVDSDYLPGVYEAACNVAEDHALRLPGRPRKVIEHKSENFQSSTWLPVAIPGVGRMFQVRTGRGDIRFRAPRQRDLNRLIAHVKALAEDSSDLAFDPDEMQQQTSILAWNNDYWDCRKSRNSRSFHSVFLPAELQAEIEADLKRFTESKDRLQRLEMPWRRGYLLSGPPGTGKTSLSLAIAGSLRFGLATLSLTDIDSDAKLRQAVGQLRPRTVLVIEDIDAHSVSHDRDHNTARDGRLSLSGLLNSLDGFETPDGLVVIATTNHIEHLDPALIRSGRFDRTFDLDNIAAAELERLFTWFYELAPLEPAPEGTKDAELAPAEVAELFKQHLNDPVAGWLAVRERIRVKLWAQRVAERQAAA